MDSSQKEGAKFFNFLQKEGVPRTGEGGSLSKGGVPTLEETMTPFAFLCSPKMNNLCLISNKFFNCSTPSFIFYFSND